MVATAFLLGAQHLEVVVENKPASSLVVSLGKALNGTPHLYVEERWPRHLGKKPQKAIANHRGILPRRLHVSPEVDIDSTDEMNEFIQFALEMYLFFSLLIEDLLYVSIYSIL